VAPLRLTRVFAASLEQVRHARTFLRDALDGCPAADDAILCLSEFAANCVVHSASRRRGGTFTISAEIYPGDYIRIEARDDGGLWNQQHNGDGRPHGLDIVASLAADWGVSGNALTGWTAWATLGWHPALEASGRHGTDACEQA
jgi:serine/threonine-protein kinase RsbW